MSERIQQSAVVLSEQSGLRVDQVAAELFAEFSRARLQAWIKSGELLVDGASVRAKDKVHYGSVMSLAAVAPVEENWQAQAIALDIVYEDASLLVINKPAGLVVHPGAGSPDGTLLNALLFHDPALAAVPRAGIVHRLDKDTTGLLVVARTLAAHTALVRQLQARTMKREYEAVVCGVLTAGGTVDAPIGRHPRDRVKMAVVATGKPAVTHYRVLQRFETLTHVRGQLESGRTHQSRVHMAHIGHPLLGDAVYGAGFRTSAKKLDESTQEALKALNRQALHAISLGFDHPGTHKHMHFESPAPADFDRLLTALRLQNTDS